MKIITSDRIHADFQWLITSPDLIDINAVAQSIDSDLYDIRNILTKSSTKAAISEEWQEQLLGKYFEELAFLAFRNTPNYVLLKSNYQLIYQHQTIGEFDCIIKEMQSNQLIHCEIAVKFFLQLNNGENLSDWVGPGLKDRLDIKYQHLIRHQLQLSRKVPDELQEKIEFLPVQYISLLTRGRLYYQLADFTKQHFRYPEEISGDHLKGFWASTEQFLELQKSVPEFEWFELPKPYWFSEIRPHDLNHLRILEIEHIENFRQAVAINHGKEMMRGFIVTPTWLKNAYA